MTLITKKPSPANILVPYILAMFGGVLVSVLGISVLFGWVTHNATLIQVSAAFVPMQFNTALGFLVSGLGLLVVTRGHLGAGTACGIFVMLIGLLTLAEYILGIDLGIDQLLMKHYITVQTSHPGRMAPNTALCFSLTGAALVVLGRTAKAWKPFMIVGVLGSLILGLAFVALTGYAVSFEAAYGWGVWTRMAVHTASGFLILGVAVISFAWHQDVSGPSRLPSWFPVPVGVGVMTIVISLWQAFDAHEALLMKQYGSSGGHSFVNNVLLVVGIVLAATLSLAVYLTQVARNREREVEATNRRLTVEIDDRKQAEKALQESEERYRSISLSSTIAMIVAVDELGTIISWNPAAEKTFGYSEAEILNHPLTDIMPERYRAAHKEGFQRAATSEEYRIIGKNIELHGLKKSGEEFPLELSLGTWKQDKTKYFSAVIHDITERKRAEEEREKLLHDQGERVKEILCMYSVTESIQRQTALEEIFQDVVELIPLGWHYPEITRGKVTFDGEEYVSEPFEETEWTQSSDIIVHGEPRGSIAVYYLEECPELDEGPFMTEERDLINGISRTISEAIERKQAEDQLRRSQKMEAIGQLAGGIAHDFNNLLGIFQSNFELLQDFNIKDDNFQKWINTGLKTVQRGASLTRRLLSFSRVDAVGTATVDINELIAELKDLLAKSLTPKITVELNLGKDEWQVNIDTDELQDALVNLALNARDAMPAGGTLQIATSNKRLDENDIQFDPGLEVGSYVIVSVSDTGCGMDKKTLEHVFDPFFTTKEKEKGTGLGLSMVYGFAKRSRGYVKIYSEVGHGTTVRLYLPMVDRKEEERDESYAEAKAMPGGTEMILAVDDEIELLQGIKHRLESLGYQVLTASNGAEALDVITSHKEDIALLFSDVVMPGAMSGYELAQEVEKRELDIKILLASGFTNSIANKTDTLNSHFEVMEKPYTKMALATKVREVLDLD